MWEGRCNYQYHLGRTMASRSWSGKPILRQQRLIGGFMRSMVVLNSSFCITPTHRSCIHTYFCTVFFNFIILTHTYTHTSPLPVIDAETLSVFNAHYLHLFSHTARRHTGNGKGTRAAASPEAAARCQADARADWTARGAMEHHQRHGQSPLHEQVYLVLSHALSYDSTTIMKTSVTWTGLVSPLTCFSCETQPQS